MECAFFELIFRRTVCFAFICPWIRCLSEIFFLHKWHSKVFFIQFPWKNSEWYNSTLRLRSRRDSCTFPRHILQGTFHQPCRHCWFSLFCCVLVLCEYLDYVFEHKWSGTLRSDIYELLCVCELHSCVLEGTAIFSLVFCTNDIRTFFLFLSHDIASGDAIKHSCVRRKVCNDHNLADTFHWKFLVL